jgi:hypothetical protein
VLQALLVPPDRGIGQFGLISAAHEHAPGLVALTVVVEREWEAAIQQLDRHRQFILALAAGKRLLDQLPCDPTPLEIPRNPLAPPTVQQPPILSKPPRVASIVNKPLLTERPNDIVNDSRFIAAPNKKTLDLTLSPLTDADRLKSPLKSLLSVVDVVHVTKGDANRRSDDDRTTGTVLCTAQSAGWRQAPVQPASSMAAPNSGGPRLVLDHNTVLINRDGIRNRHGAA